MKCSWQTEYGTINSPQMCGREIKDGRLWCAEHTRDARDLFPHLVLPQLSRKRTKPQNLTAQQNQ